MHARLIGAASQPGTACLHAEGHQSCQSSRGVGIPRLVLLSVPHTPLGSLTMPSSTCSSHTHVQLGRLAHIQGGVAGCGQKAIPPFTPKAAPLTPLPPSARLPRELCFSAPAPQARQKAWPLSASLAHSSCRLSRGCCGVIPCEAWINSEAVLWCSMCRGVLQEA